MAIRVLHRHRGAATRLRRRGPAPFPACSCGSPGWPLAAAGSRGSRCAPALSVLAKGCTVRPALTWTNSLMPLRFRHGSACTGHTCLPCAWSCSTAAAGFWAAATAAFYRRFHLTIYKEGSRWRLLLLWPLLLVISPEFRQQFLAAVRGRRLAGGQQEGPPNGGGALAAPGKQA